MLEILYQDDHLVVIHKPAGLLVHRSMIARHETRFAVQLLRDQIGRHVYPAHRLDRGTSGILVFALDPAIAATLAGAFECQRVTKRYFAIVRGHPAEEGSIDHPLRRQRDPYDARAEPPEQCDEAPQPALTHFKRLATAELPHAVDRYPTSRYALLMLEPVTGRRHQLRRHMKHIAHPIIGDATHGKGVHNRFFASCFGVDRLLLASVHARFPHPVSNRPVALTAPPAADFLAVAASLGWSHVIHAALSAPFDS